MSEKKIKGKTIDEINMLLEEASAEEQEARQAFFDEQWELLKEELAELDMISKYEDIDFGRLVMEDENLTKGYLQ